MSEFTCVDLNGIEVTCYEERWEHSIARHFEMDGKQELVKETIKNPDFINQSKTHTNRKLYYKKLTFPMLGNFYIRAVVEHKLKKGILINAFSCPAPAKGEIRLWQKN